MSKKYFGSKLEKIDKQLREYDEMMVKQKLEAMDKIGRKEISRRQQLAQNNGSRSLSIQTGGGQITRNSSVNNKPVKGVQSKKANGRTKDDKNCKVI